MRPGYYLKIPFVWELGCPEPNQATRLFFRPAPTGWLVGALAEVLATSPDPADQLAVAENGVHGAAAALLALSNSHFEQQPDWWQLAQTQAGEPVGFVLCSLSIGLSVTQAFGLCGANPPPRRTQPACAPQRHSRDGCVTLPAHRAF